MPTLEKHWTELTRNPVSDIAQSLVKHQIRQKYRGHLAELSTYWNDQLANKSILDVGVVEHSAEFIARDGWKHRVFKGIANRLVGVDILEPEVATLNAQGYDVRVCDATSNVDLGDRFDVVYIGDVIEHVNDPVALLRFAARHLGQGGKVIVTTPCPFWWRNILLALRDRTYIGNVDHLRFVCPVHALEMAHRAPLVLDHYFSLRAISPRFPIGLIQRSVQALSGPELFTWAYVYVFVSR
jgi:2-polyprenyl-3-methyl-5-hydroxy-6-metoxy-1,4-benzoquinol methylase